MEAQIMREMNPEYAVWKALRRCGYTDIEIGLLCSGEFLSDCLLKIREIYPPKPDSGRNHLVWKFPGYDLERIKANPLEAPFWQGCEVFYHGENQIFEIDKIRTDYFSRLYKWQYDEALVLEQIMSRPFLNANVLEYILANKQLIKPEWKGKAIIFAKTIYRLPNGELVVRCLQEGDLRNTNWTGSYCMLQAMFSSDDLAALL